jgi:hypothetical protein
MVCFTLMVLISALFLLIRSLIVPRTTLASEDDEVQPQAWQVLLREESRRRQVLPRDRIAPALLIRERSPGVPNPKGVSMCAHLAKPKTYAVISDYSEAPRKSRFQIARRPIKDGQFVLAQINGHHIVGRRFQLDGNSWLIQPSRWIRITNPAGVHLLGVVG